VEFPVDYLVPDGVLYYGGTTGPTDKANNLRLVGVQTVTDCYKACAMLNDYRCMSIR